MPTRIRRADWNRLLDELQKMRDEWEGTIGRFVDRRPVQGVVVGIETGRQRLAEEKPTSLKKLNALLDEWEKMGSTTLVSTVTATLDGIDYGIRLVSERVRQYFNLHRRKPPTSAKTSTATHHKRKRAG
jgi:hypothetical protein